MQRVTGWKKTGTSIKPTWIGLMLFGVLAGGIVLSGCGGGEGDDDSGSGTNTAKDAGGDDEK